MCSIKLQRQNAVPIKRQIYQALTEQILSGRLKAGDALPSTRELAAQMKVSRNTVCEAYDMLITEGFVLSRQGAPTRVADGLYMDRTSEPAPPARKKRDPLYSADFQTGRPDLRYFPQYLWQQILHKTSEELSLTQLGYSGPQGMRKLREEISAWLFRSKGLIVDADDIFITSGATHALHLISGLLSGHGNKIAIEDPCNKGILQTFLDAGCEVQPIPVDENGIQPEYLNGTDVRAVYVTPSHQFPLGGILPAGRRAELIRFAKKNGIYLVEDDYDSEFRYVGEPVAPLYAMDPKKVIYVGTFSKVLFPAIRIGYVILPRELQQGWCELRTHTDVQNSPFEQAALAEFLRSRKFDRHIRNMCKLYGKRRKVLLEALKEVFGDAWRVWGDSAGLHLAVEFPGMRFDEPFLKRCADFGIRVSTVEQHSIQKGRHLDKLLLGYGHMEPNEIQGGVSRLHSVIQI
jgi:GntR family transcriptional regulator / MocR family aminotransferase